MHLQQKEHKGRPLCALAYALYNLLMKRQKKKEKEKTEMSLKLS